MFTSLSPSLDSKLPEGKDVRACMLNLFSHVQLFVAHQAPLSMGFSRQEYWSGLPFPSPGDLPHPGKEPGSPALQILYHLSHQGSP